MLATLLATSLLIATPTDSPTRYERAFDAARRLEFAGRTPDLVFMMEARHNSSWQIVSFYPAGPGLTESRWVVRRQRVGDARWDSEYGDGPDVPLAWADSHDCDGVIPLLEAVEQIRPMPFDVYRIGTEYGADAPVMVGGARMTFWLAGATITPSVQMTGYYYLGGWWDGAKALEFCWTTVEPLILRED